MKRKRRLRQETEENSTVVCEEERLQQLLAEMEAHMKLDRILEARKTLDKMQKEGLLESSLIEKKKRTEINRIIRESDSIQESLQDLLTDDGWTKSNYSRDGIIVHSRKVEGTPLFAVKSQTIFEGCPPSDFVRLCSFFAEVDLLPLWFPQNMLNLVEILAEPSKYRKVFRLVIKFPRFVPIANRDVVAEGCGYHIQEHNAFLIHSKAIQSSPFCELPPPTKGVVRMKSQSLFLVQLLPGNRAGFSCIRTDDLKLKFVPAFIMNYISQGVFPFEQTASLKQCLANYEESEWNKRLQTRRDFYEELEKRVQEEVLAMQKDVARRQSKDLALAKESRVEGMPMWKAILWICLAVSCARWSIDSGIQLPWIVYAAFLMVIVPFLTRSVVLFRCQQV